MKTIIALVDFSDASARVLNYTQMLASALGGQVFLLHAVPYELPVAAYGAEIPAIPVAPSPATVQAYQARLDDLLRTLNQTGFSATALQGRGPVAETVIAEASRLKADLVIMGSHHHNALYKFFVGSATADVLQRASFPVLVVPCDDAEEEKQ